MAELIAQGKRPGDRWRRALPEGEEVVLGRDAAPWTVHWEDFLSRRHAALTWSNEGLEVRQLPDAHSPIFFKGQEANQFRLKTGEHFVIGSTIFQLVMDPLPTQALDGNLIKERTFHSQELKKLRVRDAARQIDVLSKLPEVLSGAADRQELFLGLVNLLLAGIPRGDAAALVSVNADGDIEILHWDSRRPIQGQFQPSQRLILEALRGQETVMHVWRGAGSEQFTQSESFDWAFCTPVRGKYGQGWGIYVAGGFSDVGASTIIDEAEASGLVDDLKFTELLAAIWSALEQVNVLQHRETTLSQFLSPAVLRELAGADPDEVLKPRRAQVTVLFCDLRGFSREAERHAEDLLHLLEGVSKALGIMTQNILDQEGVVGDFHGDAAMGFWGWPHAQANTVQNACLAALGIHTLFEAVARKSDHALSGFRVGIGLATGPAVAGKIGSKDQVKVSVFGPVVNLASRLEGMTKILRVPILIDEATSRIVRDQVPRTVARTRRLARVLPYGMDTPLVVSELLPPAPESLLTDEHIACYEEAFDAFEAGDWPKAFELLYRLPPLDRGKDFLTAFIIQNNHRPPPAWNGVIPLSSKS